MQKSVVKVEHHSGSDAPSISFQMLIPSIFGNKRLSLMLIAYHGAGRSEPRPCSGTPHSGTTCDAINIYS
ncbi:hypothetical protein N7519_007895 [Penicillium mononematosum]|uniref:uncharacterized protein n=1 Tax=Penicillium mononematosum TaxID=268346 RepID=UPI00254947BE|nr:uncharacterized protein N7519_007895 [Penicillium mononematosum]KAJ6186594.1 hypothetical protein N7519_007895 [Penicillium mononematosum]